MFIDEHITNTGGPVQSEAVCLNVEDKHNDSMRSFNDKHFKKIGLFKNKATGSKEKSYEIYVSNHCLFDNPVAWILMYDISDSLEKEKIKEDYRLKSNLVAKISHEFTTPVMSIIEMIKATAKNSYDNSVKSNLKGVKNLCEYLFVLIKELSYCINSQKNAVVSQQIFSHFDLVKLIKKIRSIIFELRDMNDMKAKSISILLKVFSERLNGFLNSEFCKVIVHTDFESLKHFLINLFIITLKIVFRGEVNIKVNLKDLEIANNEFTIEGLEQLQCKPICVTIECVSNFNINTIKDNQEASDNYNRVQGMDISYNLCKKYSDELGLNLTFNKENEILLLTFELPCKAVVADLNNKINDYESPLSLNTVQNRSHLYRKDSQLGKFIKKYVSRRPNNEIQEEEVNRADDSDSDDDYKNFKNFEGKSKSMKSEEILKELNSDLGSRNMFGNELEKLHDDNVIERKVSEIRMKTKGRNVNIKNQIHILNMSFPLRKESRTSKLSKFFSHKLSSKKILIADDVSTIRSSIKNILTTLFSKTQEEYDIIECTDGIEILNKIYELYSYSGEVVISCLITDQFMNFMNGSDAIRIIHSLESEHKIKKIPIIVATAFQDEININNILSVNPDKILNKPVNKVVLHNALKEINLI